MLRSAQPSQSSTYPSQYIDTPGLAVLILNFRIRSKKGFVSNNVFQGDSGGPATYKHGDQHILAGVFSSYISPCGSQAYVERVAYYRIHFIEKILNGATVCKSGVDVDVDVDD